MRNNYFFLFYKQADLIWKTFEDVGVMPSKLDLQDATENEPESMTIDEIFKNENIENE